MARIRLDEGVVDALFLEPRQQEVAQLVRRHSTLQAGRLRVALQHAPDAALAILLLPRRLEEISRPFLTQLGHMQAQRFLERIGERNNAILVAFPLIDPDLAAVE